MKRKMRPEPIDTMAGIERVKVFSWSPLSHMNACKGTCRELVSPNCYARVSWKLSSGKSLAASPPV